jgi:hypothetical protein
MKCVSCKLVVRLFVTAVVFTADMSCSPRLKNSIPTVDFCELSNHLGKQVRVNCDYSGVEEYSRLSRPGKEGCLNTYSVDLWIPRHDLLPKGIQKKFTAVQNSYWNRYLELSIVGVFDTGRVGGYGHLGSKNAQFTVEKFERIKLIRRSN